MPLLLIDKDRVTALGSKHRIDKCVRVLRSVRE
jgi:hypothetical protein